MVSRHIFSLELDSVSISDLGVLICSDCINSTGRLIHVTITLRANGTLVRIVVLVIVLSNSVSRLEEQEKLVTAEGLYRRALDLDDASAEAQEALRKITETIQVSHSSAIISPEFLLLWAVAVATVAQQDAHLLVAFLLSSSPLGMLF